MEQFRSLLVPITDSAASLEAVAIACAIARPQRARVHALHVIEVLRSLPLDAPVEDQARQGEQLLRRAEEAAHATEYTVDGDLVQAREAGQAIVEQAAELGVDAILMGVGYKRLIGGFQVGRTTDYVLRHAHCRVWVLRPALGDPAGPGQHRERGGARR